MNYNRIEISINSKSKMASKNHSQIIIIFFILTFNSIQNFLHLTPHSYQYKTYPFSLSPVDISCDMKAVYLAVAGLCPARGDNAYQSNARAGPWAHSGEVTISYRLPVTLIVFIQFCKVMAKK